MIKATKERALSKVGRTAGNPCPSGYDALAHQHGQSILVRISLLSPQCYDPLIVINLSRQRTKSLLGQNKSVQLVHILQVLGHHGLVRPLN
jgi:hypothetical protein